MKSSNWFIRSLCAIGLVVTFFSFKSTAPDAQTGVDPIYITDITTVGEQIAITQKTNKEVALYNTDFSMKLRSWKLSEVPTGVVTDGSYLYVTSFEKQGSVNVINLKNDEIRTIPTGSGAIGPVWNPQKKVLYVCNQFANTVSEVNVEEGEVKRTVALLREPKQGVMGVDGKYLFVTNFLPQQKANLDTVSACLSVVDTHSFSLVKHIPLANGSNALRGVAASPDGKYIFVSHNLGRFQVPTNQLQQGWMNTSAISIINAKTLAFEGAVLLDDPERGAAGIWAIHCTPEKLIITHSGTHEISIVDYPAFIRRFEETPRKDELAYDLRFLYGLRTRVKLTGNGPRQFVLNGSKAIIPTYFSDTVNVVNLDIPEQQTFFALAPERQESRIHKGEKYFNDASLCFQNWQSCNGCHPGDARTDGMNWDLMNDGIGNSKNCKSMLYSHVTAPNMISGIRASAHVAVRAGYNFIQFCDVPEEYAQCVDEYLMALRPVPSPYLVNGELSEKAKLGRKVFEKLDCTECHSGPYFTDMKMHRIGDDIEFEQGWDTPTLVEVWRTGPYLFDGRAATMEEVFKEHKHGINKKVSQKDMDALVEYVNSL